MSKFTIATAKKALALAFPDIEFTYGKAGRGHAAGPCVSWVGGPDAWTIRSAAGYVWSRTPSHFVRQDTPEERDAKHARWEAEEEARKAAEPARRAAAKAAGVEKRKATTAFKKARTEALADAFPGVEFSLSGDRVSWTDGPDVKSVAALLSISDWLCDRSVSREFQEAKAAEVKAAIPVTRLARRLAASRARAIQIADGVARRLKLRDDASRQLMLPLDLPCLKRAA